jgi:DHA1 family multidrug resistance protein-like MFS transporter
VNWRVLLVLLSATLALNGSLFMLIPVFPVHVTATLGLSAAAAGLVLAVRQFLQNVPTVLGGAIADRFNAKPAMVGGLLFRALAFAALGYAADLWGLLLASVLAALSGSLFDAASRSAIAHFVAPGQRARAFGLVSVVFVVGSSVGPLLGAATFAYGFAFLCLVSAGWLTLAAVSILVLVPSWSRAGADSKSVRGHLATVFTDRAFVRLSLISSGFWYLGAVLYIALPLHVQAVTGRADIAGFLFSLYAVLVLIFQYPVISYSASRLSPMARLSTGLAASSIGYLAVGAAGGVLGLVAAMGLFALGRMLTEPTYSELITELSPPGSVATYAGLGFIGLGIGGALGNVTGGLLFDLAAGMGSLWLPWLVYGLIGLGLALLFRAMRTYSGHLTAVSAGGRGTN